MELMDLISRRFIGGFMGCDVVRIIYNKKTGGEVLCL